MQDAEHICVLLNEGGGYCKAPTFLFDKMGRSHSPVPMDRGQSSSYEEVQQGVPSRLRGQRGRLELQGPLDVG
jgi:hypothetical protein